MSLDVTYCEIENVNVKCPFCGEFVSVSFEIGKEEEYEGDIHVIENSEKRCQCGYKLKIKPKDAKITVYDYDVIICENNCKPYVIGDRFFMTDKEEILIIEEVFSIYNIRFEYKMSNGKILQHADFLYGKATRLQRPNENIDK